MAISFLPSNNFAGSSRYASAFLPSLSYKGSAATRTLLGGGPTASSPGTDYGLYDTASGKVISMKTGEPWTGVEPRTGVEYVQGVKVNKPAGGIDPNNPAERYKPVDIVKSPAVAGLTSDLMAQFKKSADASLQDFGANMKGAEAARDIAFKNTQAAANIEPFAATTRALTGRYTGALDTAAADYAALNAGNAAAMRALEAEGKGILPRYDAAAEAIAARQEDALRAQIGRYKALSGTPTSLGSAEERMLLGGIRDIRLPLEQAKIAREYDYLQNVSLPVQRELAGRETSRIAQFNPMVAGQAFQAATGTENTIQNLRLQTANMSFTQADSYLRSMGIPELLRQQILAGHIQALGGLSALEEASRYRGLQDVMGVNVSQPQYYNVGTPGYPASRYTQPTVTMTSPLASNPGAVVRPATATNRYGYDGVNYDANDYVMAGMNSPGESRYAGYTPSPGLHANSVYDPVSGNLIDRTTGAVTGTVSQPSEWTPPASRYVGDVLYPEEQYA